MTSVLTREPTGERAPALPEGWLRALVAALEAVLLGWVVCVVPAIAAYVATAASPALGQTTWHSALGVGSAGWLLGHGAPAGQLALVPLGLSAVFAALAMLTARRHRLRGWALVIGAVCYVVLVQAASLLSPFAVDHVRLAGGSLVVAGVGAAWSWRRSGVRTRPVIAADVDAAPSDALTHRLRLVAVRAARGAGAALAILAVVGLLVALAAITLNAGRVLDIHTSYAAGIVGGTVLVLGQLAYLPTAAVWGLAYVAGPGFSVGTGTVVSAGAVELGAVPAIPLLGALPEATSPVGPWPAVLIVLAGIVAAWWTARPGHAHRLVDAVAAALGTAIGVGVVTLVLGAAASGSIGTGRMAEIGPDPLVLAGMVTALVAAGAALTTIVLHPRTRAAALTGARAARERLRRVPEESSPGDAVAVPKPGRWSATGSMASAATPRSADSSDSPGSPDSSGRTSD